MLVVMIVFSTLNNRLRIFLNELATLKTARSSEAYFYDKLALKGHINRFT